MSLHFFCHKLANKIISTNGYTDSHKAVRAKRVKVKIPTKLSKLGGVINECMCHIEERLLSNSLGKNSSLGNIKLQTCVFFEYALKLL